MLRVRYAGPPLDAVALGASLCYPSPSISGASADAVAMARRFIADLHNKVGRLGGVYRHPCEGAAGTDTALWPRADHMLDLSVRLVSVDEAERLFDRCEARFCGRYDDWKRAAVRIALVAAVDGREDAAYAGGAAWGIEGAWDR